MATMVDSAFYQGQKQEERDKVWEEVNKLSLGACLAGDDCGMEQCRDQWEVPGGARIL